MICSEPWRNREIDTWRVGSRDGVSTAAVGPITVAGLVVSSMVFQGSSSASGGPVARQNFSPCISSQRAERGYPSQHHGRWDGNGGERQFVGVSAVNVSEGKSTGTDAADRLRSCRSRIRNRRSGTACSRVDRSWVCADQAQLVLEKLRQPDQPVH
jgi:hypothetical protein